LEAYGRLGIISGACKVAKVGRTIVYTERARNPGFAEAWDEVEQHGIDEVELAARMNALGGNATMQMFLLKTRRRELYGLPTPPAARHEPPPHRARHSRAVRDLPRWKTATGPVLRRTRSATGSGQDSSRPCPSVRTGFAALDDADKQRVLSVARRELTP
jgi:hypothetical protein